MCPPSPSLQSLSLDSSPSLVFPNSDEFIFGGPTGPFGATFLIELSSPKRLLLETGRWDDVGSALAVDKPAVDGTDDAGNAPKSTD